MSESSGKSAKPRQYGVKTRNVFKEVEENPKNVFGQRIIREMTQKGHTINSLLASIGFYLRRFYGLLADKEYAKATDPEVVFRLAGAMGIPEVEMLALYFRSRERYYSADYRGKYQMREYEGEHLANLTASFITLWEALIHSPQFLNADQEQQGKIALRAVTLLEPFLQMEQRDQETILRMVEGLAPKREAVVVEPTERTEEKEEEQAEE